MPDEGFLRLRYRVPQEWQEDFAAAVWTEEFLGLETEAAGGAAVECYFRSGAPVPELDALWVGRGVELLSSATVADEDWLRTYRISARPFPLGRGFFVDPGEPRERCPVPEGRCLLRIPARRAFGTGSHETTRLAVDLLEDTDLSERRVLDVGCGTGILSFVSLLLGARMAVAIDLDPAAVFNCRDNVRRIREDARRIREDASLNRFQPRLTVAGVDALAEPTVFDLVVINILPGRILSELGRLSAAVAPRGRLHYTGAREEEAGEVEGRLASAGLEVIERRSEGGWLGWATKRRDRPRERAEGGR